MEKKESDKKSNNVLLMPDQIEVMPLSNLMQEILERD